MAINRDGERQLPNASYKRKRKPSVASMLITFANPRTLSRVYKLEEMRRRGEGSGAKMMGEEEGRAGGEKETGGGCMHAFDDGSF